MSVCEKKARVKEKISPKRVMGLIFIINTILELHLNQRSKIEAMAEHKSEGRLEVSSDLNDRCRVSIEKTGRETF